MDKVRGIQKGIGDYLHGEGTIPIVEPDYKEISKAWDEKREREFAAWLQSIGGIKNG